MDSTKQKTKGFFKQGWVRAISLLFAFLGASILTALVFEFVLGILHGEAIKNKAFSVHDAMTSSLSPLLVLISALIGFLLVWLFAKFIDKRSFASLGFDWKGYESHAATGFFMPLVLLGTGTVILSFAHYLTWIDFHFSLTTFFINLVLMLLIAFSEELIFRGYVLNNLMQSFNRRFALIVSALLFAIFHMGSPGANILPLINVFIAGLLLGINYSHTRNLWFGMTFHFVWNFFQGPVLGFKVSGKILESVFEQELRGPQTMTGGQFGFEGSILCTILTLLAVITLEWVYTMKFKSDTKTVKSIADKV